MKRMLAALLALVMLMGITAAEGVDGVNAYVSRQGFKAISSRNRSRISGCWFTADDGGETLQWSDQSNTYTVTAKAGKGLRGLYVDIVGMSDWDTCSFTEDGRVQYAYNAPDVDAVKSYKTLKNYAKYVTAHVDETEVPLNAGKSAGRQSYILNTNSKKFHNPNCAFADKIKKSNRDKFTGTRDELIQMGYEPCKKCNP